jgi:tRNA A37 threonylcarbamoyltransferase TsaD
MMHRINQQLAQQSKELAEQSKVLTEQSKDLGVQTTILALQASTDNASMITLAAVTMFFLPASFISVRRQLEFR